MTDGLTHAGGCAVIAVDRSLSISGLRYHLAEWDGGGDTTVLLLHGWLGFARGWDLVVEALPAQDWHLVAPDWRGHGDTEWVGAGGYYHFADYIRDLEQIVAAVARERLIIVAHSMGTNVAGLWAGTRPGRAAGLVLLDGVGPIPVSPTLYPSLFAQWLDQTAPFTESLRPMRDLDHATRRLLRAEPLLGPANARRMAEHATRALPDGQRAWKHDPLHRTRAPMPTLPSIAAEFWKRVTCPVLWLGGALSPWRRPETEAWIDSLADARRVTVPDAGHMVHYDAPTAVAAALAEFIQSASRSR